MPQIAYCTDEAGYYTHSEYCTIDPLESAKQGHDVYVLPANGYLDAPVIATGCVARRVNGAWVDVENHVGEKGFVNGVPTEIKDYGPLPEGWSVTLPAPPLAEVQAEKRQQINAGFEAALVASLTMPSVNPSAVEVAVGAAALAAVDADGPAYIMQTHSARRAALLAAVDAANSVEAVQAITVSYAV